MTILITGVAGFIGMHSAIRFLKEGKNVIGIDNLNDYYSVTLKKDRLNQIYNTEKVCLGSFKFYPLDIAVDSLDLSVDFDVILHLAAQAGVRYSIENPMAYVHSNIIGFQNVMDFAKTHKNAKFIYASSSSVYGKTTTQPFNESDQCNSPESFYAATKISNEVVAKSYFNVHGTRSLGLRFFTVYGPWGRPDMAPMLFALSAIESKEIEVFNYGKQRRDFTYIDDIIEGIYRISEIEFGKITADVVNIGNGAPVNLLDFIEHLESAFGTKLKKQFVEGVKGDVEETYADTSKLKKLINFTPRTDIAEGVAAFADWYKSYYE